jgi:hypothetical protein
MRPSISNLVIAAALCAARAAAADPIVLAVDGGDIYIGLGARDGVGAGSELELLHEVTAKDPRTGQTLSDHFALGTLAVTRSGDHVSVAKADDELRARVLAGDHVRLVSAVRAFSDPWADKVAANHPSGGMTSTPTANGIDTSRSDHAELARAAWQETLGKPLEARVERWLVYLKADPQSPYRAEVQKEIATLKTQINARAAALANARAARTDDRTPRIAELSAQLASSSLDARSPILAGRLARAVTGQPIPMSFTVRAPAGLVKAWLYARTRGDAGYKRIELVADGDAYLRGTVGKELVHGDAVQWYVEAQFGKQEPEAVLGDQGNPREIAVEASVGEAPIAEGRSHIDLHVDYVDFDGGLNKGFDQYYQAELDFTYRFIEPVYAVRLGFGTLTGVGGPKDVIDADMTGHCLDSNGTFQCARVSFSYVYSEVELRLQKSVALMLRPQAGLLTTDEQPDMPENRCRDSANTAGCRFLTGVGGRVRLRLGEEAGTNLVIGAGFTQGVGTLLEASYHWLPASVVPVQFSVQVTDQPVVKDLGVRLIADVGWKQLSWFYPSARVSYQARDIDHAGVSGGLAMNFDW